MHTTAAGSLSTETPTDISNGWGADYSRLERPGIPHEHDPPRRLASAHWLELEQQASDRQPLVGQGLKLTPVFSSAVPPRGVSGALRRLAYRMPDYRARRWLLLMVADRIDVVEHRPGRLVGAFLALTVMSLGALAIRGMARR